MGMAERMKMVSRRKRVGSLTRSVEAVYGGLEDRRGIRGAFLKQGGARDVSKTALLKKNTVLRTAGVKKEKSERESVPGPRVLARNVPPRNHGIVRRGRI